MATMTEPAVVTAEKAGFWTRVLAFIIDVILVGIVSQIVVSVIAGGDLVRSQGISTLIGLAYYLYFWTSYGGGQTLGMRALNIKVIRTDGTQLDLVGGLLRYVGLIVSFAVVFIGVIWVAFDSQKQGWHDKIARTYVVRA
jgi:uncharacterized RDD family membrane protein YckC